MEFNFNSKIKVPDEIIVQQTGDGQCIMLNTKTENYYGLDEIGTVFYNNLINSQTINEAFRNLHNSYEVDKITLKNDLRSFISDLGKNKLIEIKRI